MHLLLDEIGFRPPSRDEITRAMARRARDEWCPDGEFNLPAALLHADPVISYSGLVPRAPLGLAGVASGRLGGRDAWFLLSPTWSIEEEGIAAKIRELAIHHRLSNPNHRLVVICNSPGEVDLLRNVGEAAFLYNKTANTVETVFRPLRGVPIAFDAIHNAQLASWKRHELSFRIETCAHLFHLSASGSDPGGSGEEIAQKIRQSAPGHVLINRIAPDGRAIRLPLKDVNKELNRAAIGLCLSAREGAMFASTEYLLAGLPIVSTPSVGGRDLYYDSSYCLIAEPDPRSVAEAVRALKENRIPRSHIRRMTLRKIEADRDRFVGLINAIFTESGSGTRLERPWPFRKHATMDWHKADEALHRAMEGIVDGFPKKRPIRDRLRRIMPLTRYGLRQLHRSSSSADTA
jgi:Glycosyl transferases group 1